MNLIAMKFHGNRILSYTCDTNIDSMLYTDFTIAASKETHSIELMFDNPSLRLSSRRMVGSLLTINYTLSGKEKYLG